MRDSRVIANIKLLRPSDRSTIGEVKPLVWLHLLFVIILMLIFPISKLLHAPAVFFSPTRNQTDYRYNAKPRGTE